jgi:hypothetical protein
MWENTLERTLKQIPLYSDYVDYVYCQLYLQFNDNLQIKRFKYFVSTTPLFVRLRDQTSALLLTCLFIVMIIIVVLVAISSSPPPP